MSPLLRRSLIAAAACLGAVGLTWWLSRPGDFVTVGGILLLYVIALSLGRRLTALVAGAAGAVAAYAMELWPGRGGPAPQSGAALGFFAAALAAVVGSAVLWRARARAADEVVLGLERRYRRLVDRNLAGVLGLTLRGEVSEANDTAAETLGCNGRSGLLGRNLEEFFAQPEGWAALRARTLRERQVPNLEIEFRRLDGARIWALCQFSLAPGRGGSAATIEGTVLDISERKQTEDILRVRERRFRALIENSADAIALLTLKGEVIYASDSTERVLGYTPEQLQQVRLAELIHPEDLEAAGLLWRQAIAHPGANVQAQYRCRGADGQWRWIEGTFCDLTSTPGIRAVVVNYRDVSERKGLEQQLRQSQKLEAMGRLAGGIAHDFNNLLTVITGYSDIALLRLGPPAESLRKPLEEIKRAGERAAGLTRQLLAFSREQALAPQVLELNRLVEGMEQMLRPLIGEAIRIRPRLGGRRLLVRADAAQIEQMLLNLAVNARDAMPEGGDLTLTTGQVEILPGTGPDRPAPGRYVLLCVADTGCGMTPEVQARIFEPFFTTKERGKGTGLGLAMVYGIMRQSGGHVEVKSAPGQGSQFYLYFPVVAEKEAPSTSLPAAAAAPQATILLAEDEDGVRALVRDTLTAAGFQVLVSRDGREALQICAEHPGRIDLLLTDVVMPNLDGRRLAERLHALRPETKILFMSGFADPQLGDNRALGPLLQKPFSPDAVPRRVRELLGQNF